MKVDQIINERNMKNKILNLSLLTDIERKIPTGILKIGVNIAMPGIPKLLLIRTINLFHEVNLRFVRLGNIFLNQRLRNSPKKVKMNTPNIPPPTVLT